MSTTDTMRRRFARNAAELNATVAAAREVWPDACLYLECSTLNLMAGPHHDDANTPRPDRVIAAHIIDHADGGAW